jgi:hypothetical protein
MEILFDSKNPECLLNCTQKKLFLCYKRMFLASKSLTNVLHSHKTNILFNRDVFYRNSGGYLPLYYFIASSMNNFFIFNQSEQ